MADEMDEKMRHDRAHLAAQEAAGEASNEGGDYEETYARVFEANLKPKKKKNAAAGAEMASSLAHAIELVTCAVTILKLTRHALLALGDEDCTDWFVLTDLSREIDEISLVIQKLRR